MSAMQRRKGARAEVDVVNYIRQHGYPDARRYLAGDGRQPGDLDGIPGVCCEIKDCVRLELPAWLRQVENEAGPNLPVVVSKIRGITDPGEWAATMRLRHFLDLIRPDTGEVAA